MRELSANGAPSGRGGEQSELDALEFAVEHEGGETGRDVVIGDKLQVEEVELEGTGRLQHTLVHTVEELHEDGREAGLIVERVVAAAREAMTRGQPLALHEHAEAVHRPVERIEHELDERAQRRRGVPAVLEAHEHRGGAARLLTDARGDRDRGGEQRLHLLEPSRLGQLLEEARRHGRCLRCAAGAVGVAATATAKCMLDGGHDRLGACVMTCFSRLLWLLLCRCGTVLVIVGGLDGVGVGK